MLKSEQLPMKTLISGYNMSKKSVDLMGRYMNPPNPDRVVPNPYKRCVKEHRAFDIVNG